MEIARTPETNYRVVVTHLGTDQVVTTYGTKEETRHRFLAERTDRENNDIRTAQCPLNLAQGGVLVQLVQSGGLVSAHFYADSTTEPEQKQPSLVIAQGNDFEASLQQFVALLQARENAYARGREHTAHNTARFAYTVGPKYSRITRDTSAYAFIDRQGNIYKPAGYKGPAKHVRGNIFAQPSALAGTGLYGVDYLR